MTYFFLRKIFKICTLKDNQYPYLYDKVSFTIDFKKDLKNLKKIIINNKKNILLNKKELIEISKNLKIFKKRYKIKKIKLVTNNYNVRLKNDQRF